jgi:16S rRNA (guanine527-N7)-methyltransferase
LVRIDHEPSAEVRTLAARYALPPAAASRLQVLLELVATDPYSPTSVRDPSAVLDDHLADSLVALEVAAVHTARTIVDLGAGAGFPGLALAIALPNAGVSLVESNARKCAFIERAITVTRTTNARAVNARAEAWPEGLGRFGVATARALAPLAVVAEYAAPLLCVGGTLVAWRGRREPEVEAAASAAAAELGLKVGVVLRVQPYSTAQHRHLHLMSKVKETPITFPRRPGAARKHPLGGV